MSLVRNGRVLGAEFPGDHEQSVKPPCSAATLRGDIRSLLAACGAHPISDNHGVTNRKFLGRVLRDLSGVRISRSLSALWDLPETGTIEAKLEALGLTVLRECREVLGSVRDVDRVRRAWIRQRALVAVLHGWLFPGKKQKKPSVPRLSSAVCVLQLPGRTSLRGSPSPKSVRPQADAGALAGSPESSVG